MEWIAISGSWRTVNSSVEADVRRDVRQIIREGNGIITGGALGVDSIALDEALANDKTAERIKVILPTPLPVYKQHYLKRAAEGVITFRQAGALVAQLEELQSLNPDALIEMDYQSCNKESYYARNTEVLALADRLNAYQVNQSAGTQDTIDKARKAGMPVDHKSYAIPVEKDSKTLSR